MIKFELQLGLLRLFVSHLFFAETLDISFQNFCFGTGGRAGGPVGAPWGIRKHFGLVSRHPNAPSRVPFF